MQNSSNRHPFLIGALLVLLLVATRGRHFATWHSLPSASWAVFFLAGIYLRPRWILPALLASVWTMDFAPHLLGGAGLREIIEGGQAYCLTPGYFTLLPAYAALWFAGRWYARRHRFAWRSLLPLAAATVGGAVLCELLSSGGFYLLSGRFTEPNVAEFAERLATYFPQALQSMAFYVGIAAVIHAMVVLARSAAGSRKLTAAR
ncbi:MAG: hypothetical protein KDG52_19535 [Rhodocyclaceae bacterium]|nr:hypothetical protein [Rhodocyclaceae bacterium]